jgi:hypothetical protein
MQNKQKQIPDALHPGLTRQFKHTQRNKETKK